MAEAIDVLDEDGELASALEGERAARVTRERAHKRIWFDLDYVAA